MSLVIGVAGHIDHGKTALVRALTGMDCDRLAEEKRRGITIELGFAWYDPPQGGRIGIVDMPGHERFVRAMVAGATGIDAVMLVVAADEGIMPQTREHLDVCALLGIRAGMVALTKTDLVDQAWLEMVAEDVRLALQGGPLAQAPIIPVSIPRAAGLDAVRAWLNALAGAVPARRAGGAFRLSVDRAFSVRGHGTVATGTVLSGAVRPEQEAEILPAGRVVRVRSVERHGARTAEARAGQRAALNLAGTDLASVRRGDVLAAPGTLEPASAWLLHLHMLASAPFPLKNRAEVHFHHGCAEVRARIRFFDRDALRPGETAFCQARFSAPLAGASGDHFVLRGGAPVRTIAGGRVAYALGMTVRARDCARTLSLLRSLLEDASGSERVAACLELAGAPVCAARLAQGAGLEPQAVADALAILLQKRAAARMDPDKDVYVSCGLLDRLGADCVAHIQAFHAREPGSPGPEAASLLSGWGRNLKPALARCVLETLLQERKLLPAGAGRVRLPEHRPQESGGLDRAAALLRRAYTDAGRAPANADAVLSELGLDKKQGAAALKSLCASGDLCKLNEQIYYAAPVLREIQDTLAGWLAEHAEITPGQFKTLFNGMSRKYVIALLEYFDRVRLTLRVGDTRRLRKPGTPGPA